MCNSVFLYVHITRVVKNTCGTQKYKRLQKKERRGKKIYSYGEPQICRRRNLFTSYGLQNEKKDHLVPEKKWYSESVFFGCCTPDSWKPWKWCVHGLHSTPTRTPICLFYFHSKISVVKSNRPCDLKNSKYVLIPAYYGVPNPSCGSVLVTITVRQCQCSDDPV